MGNICCSIKDGGRRRRHSRRRTNIFPATETAPPQPPPPGITRNRFVFAAATPYSNPYPRHFYQYPGYYPSTPAPYDHLYNCHYPPHIDHHQSHPWVAGGRCPMIPPPFVEHQKAVTIPNDVNLKKETLRLEPDPGNPSRLLVSFTFDAIASGRSSFHFMIRKQSETHDAEIKITVVFFAEEGREFNLTATKGDTLPPITVDFEKGLGQKFIQPSGTGIDLSVFEDSELFKESKTDIYPLAIKAEAAAPVADSREGKSESANAQITQAVYVKEKGEIKIQVVEQILWVNGLRYVLQDIYGTDGRVEDTTDPAKECVICLSEPRDTTVLPCRHMCMCSGCAKVLRFQTNRCPICRQPAERLLEIQVNGNRNGGNGDGDEQT
ncbi:unnamed protein product [Thlaspi arvense]|uniref:RING-type E3 ubiquitin transferase n=1 Tax=Thlaspi arvense TaxID=13288 RepID=A0AAU9SZA8_THLAR|nr:unnamed protein product [Thlaspi arvense]